MATDLRATHAYDSDPERVFAMLTDEQFLREKLEYLKNTDIEVLECAQAGDVFRIVTKRTVEVDVPGFAKKFVSPHNTVTQTDEWSAPVNGVRNGTWTVDVKNVPVAMSGTMRLEPSGVGAVETILGQAKASIPLVGGKLERLIADGFDDQMAKENEFGRTWLTRG